ncbi:MAG: SPOCS domain-containing protein [Porcipelethomonas sp.]
MNLKVNREILSVNEKVYDGTQEQSVELDYILPDYCPDIFKLINCSVSPAITSRSVNGDSLNYELSADIKILYCAENDSTVQCIRQRLVYNRTAALGGNVSDPDIRICPKTDHINCRVVNKRRIDMRGAVSVKISVTGESKQEAICDINGMNIQMKKIPVEYMAKKIIRSKVITISDDVELNMSKPPAISIVRNQVMLSEPEKKIIANKLVAKGEAEIKLLYTCTDGMETMGFTVPYSQIIDMEGIDESYECTVKAETLSCDISPAADSSGENKLLRCELRIELRCCGYKTIPVKLVSDAFSTSYPCEYARAKLSVEQPPVIINERLQNKITMGNEENSISCVYDVWCSVKNLNVSIDPVQKVINVGGMLCYHAMIKNESNYPAVIEKDSAFEHQISCTEVTPQSSAELEAIPCDCTYTLTDTGGISIKSDIKINGELYSAAFCEVLTDITVDDTVKITRDGDYALKLYYGVKGENVWNIAKKYCTSVSGIIEENSLEKDCLSEDGMLLIPIV